MGKTLRQPDVKHVLLFVLLISPFIAACVAPIWTGFTEQTWVNLLASGFLAFVVGGQGLARALYSPKAQPPLQWETPQGCSISDEAVRQHIADALAMRDKCEASDLMEAFAAEAGLKRVVLEQFRVFVAESDEIAIKVMPLMWCTLPDIRQDPAPGIDCNLAGAIIYARFDAAKQQAMVKSGEWDLWFSLLVKFLNESYADFEPEAGDTRLIPMTRQQMLEAVEQL